MIFVFYEEILIREGIKILLVVISREGFTVSEGHSKPENCSARNYAVT